MALFVVIAGISHIGIIQDLANLLVKAGNGNMFVLYTLIVFGSVLCSAFIDNIPYVATMLPVIAAAGASLGSSTPYVLYFGLLVGATLGGNITPIGASANIATIGLLRKSGYEVSTKEFMKYSVPFTIVAVLTGYVFIWLVWA
jgi:Na+/H+ antiporter NhaD/arsenite permease-like protein